MRWKFIDARDQQAIDRRNAMLPRVNGFWAAFSDRAVAIERAIQQGAVEDEAAWADEQLSFIDTRLKSAPELTEEGHCTMTVTPGSHLQLRPMVRSLVRRAPQLAGWEFHAHRRPLPVALASKTVVAQAGHGFLTTTVLPRIGDGNRVDLLYLMRLAATDDRAAMRVARATTDALLGEELRDRWVGEIDVTELSRDVRTQQFLGLSKLRSTVLAMAKSILQGLPVTPYFAQRRNRAEWEKYSVEPRPSNRDGDFAGQDDVITGLAKLPELQKATHAAGSKFFSGNFSRCKEVFTYLKIDLPDSTVEARRKRKYALEDAIDPALRAAKAGCLIGTGTGTRYIYLDLAVVDVPAAVEVVRRTLSPLGLPDRSWLLFHDAELAAEYVNLGATLSPPPVAPPELRSAAVEPEGSPAGVAGDLEHSYDPHLDETYL